MSVGVILCSILRLPTNITCHDKPDKEGIIKHAGVSLEGESFAVMDSARAHNFTFNEAISFMVHCDTQEQMTTFGRSCRRSRGQNSAGG
jgi:predicted 3-demethylubiquinone-9 3-methyltransferase (glyoxalase superfamily)